MRRSSLLPSCSPKSIDAIDTEAPNRATDSIPPAGPEYACCRYPTPNARTRRDPGPPRCGDRPGWGPGAARGVSVWFEAATLTVGTDRNQRSNRGRSRSEPPDQCLARLLRCRGWPRGGRPGPHKNKPSGMDRVAAYAYRTVCTNNALRSIGARPAKGSVCFVFDRCRPGPALGWLGRKRAAPTDTVTLPSAARGRPSVVLARNELCTRSTDVLTAPASDLHRQGPKTRGESLAPAALHVRDGEGRWQRGGDSRRRRRHIAQAMEAAARATAMEGLGGRDAGHRSAAIDPAGMEVVLGHPKTVIGVPAVPAAPLGAETGAPQGQPGPAGGDQCALRTSREAVAQPATTGAAPPPQDGRR